MPAAAGTRCALVQTGNSMQAKGESGMPTDSADLGNPAWGPLRHNAQQQLLDHVADSADIRPY